MKAMILLITAPFMMMFAVAALQTIEWNLENDQPVPVLAYILLIVVAIWCFCAAKLKQSDIDEFNKLNNEKRDEE